MAALLGKIDFGGAASLSLAAGVTKTVAQFTAPANRRVKILDSSFRARGGPRTRRARTIAF